MHAGNHNTPLLVWWLGCTEGLYYVSATTTLQQLVLITGCWHRPHKYVSLYGCAHGKRNWLQHFIRSSPSALPCRPLSATTIWKHHKGRSVLVAVAPEFRCTPMVLSQGESFLPYSLPLIVFFFCVCPTCPAEDKPSAETGDPSCTTPHGQAFPRKFGGKGWVKMDSHVWTDFQMEPKMLIRKGSRDLFWSCKNGSKARLEDSGGLGLLTLNWEVRKTSAQPPPFGMHYEGLEEATAHFLEGVTDLVWGSPPGFSP